MAKRMITATLEGVAAFLQSQGFKVERQTPIEVPVAADLTVPIREQLIMPLGEVDKLPLLLRISKVSGTAGADEKIRALLEEDEEGTVSEDDVDFFQFFCLLPFHVADDAVLEVARLILGINASMELAGFGMLEADRIVFYRYAYPFSGEEIDGEIIMSILAVIDMLFELFLPSIEEVAKEKKTVLQVRQAAEQAVIDAEFALM